MVQWLFVILVYDFAVLKLSLSEVTLALRLLHYKNRNGLTYENRPCDTRLEHDINRDGRCDTGFLFCLVHLPFQNPHNCTLGDYFTGFVGSDDIHFINIDQQLLQGTSLTNNNKKQRSSLISLWFQPTIYFSFKYPKTGIGLIVEVFDMDDVNNYTIHDSIDFYGVTLNDLKVYRSLEVARPHRIFLRSLFGTYTNLTADFSLYCSPNYYGIDCETFCLPNLERYECDLNTGQKICKHGYFGQDCISGVLELQACEDQPCLNNGTCVVYLGSYLCQCQKGYTGRSCEISPAVESIDRFCNRETCIHGDCSKTTGQCLCHAGWTSENCNQSLIENACSSRPCLHNSTCEDLMVTDPSPGYRCHCRVGYIGRNCEIAIVTSCERTPCIHGRCLKIDLYTEICVCEDNWGGIDCSESSIIRTTTELVTTATEKAYTVAAKSYIKISTTMIPTLKNLSLTPLTYDLNEYIEWLTENSVLDHLPNRFQSSLTPTAPHKNNSPCSSMPCHHNATCVIKSEDTFQCVCASSFIGVYCEIETNLCENSPCQHQSVCVTKSNHDIQCICQSNYTGKYCEILLSTESTSSNTKCTRLCYNGGICFVDKSNKELCVCKPSYTGFSCESPQSSCNDSSCYLDPCLSNPCLSNGTCQSVMPSKNYTCSCLEQYAGDRCEYSLKLDPMFALSRDVELNYDENHSRHGADLWPLAIVFGYVFSLMLVFIIIWFLWYGFTIRPQSYFRSDIPYGERTTARYQPYRLGVSNPIFFTNHEYNPNQILKPFPN